MKWFLRSKHNKKQNSIGRKQSVGKSDAQNDWYVVDQHKSFVDSKINNLIN